MLARARDLGGHVLNERSAERDVDELHAPTNRQRGELATEGFPSQREFGAIALGVRGACRRMGRFTEVARIDVLASREHEAFDDIENLADRSDVAHRRNDERHEASAGDSVDIALVDAYAACSIDDHRGRCYANEWDAFGHGLIGSRKPRS